MNFYTSLNVIFYKHIRSNYANLEPLQLAIANEQFFIRNKDGVIWSIAMTKVSG